MSGELKKFLEEIRGQKPQAGLSLQEMRDAFESWMNLYSPDLSVIFQPLMMDAIPAAWAYQPESSEEHVILFFHGGGFNLGSFHSHRHFIGRLVEESGMRALAIDYRLSPENPFPAALEDCIASYLWLLEEDGYDPSEVILAGCSAGGGLVVSTLLALKEKGFPLPRAGLCFSPWVDLAMTGASLKTNAGTDVITSARLKSCIESYLKNNEDVKNPLISPLYGDLSGLPPLLIQAGGGEILLDDAKHLAAKAKEQRVKSTLEIYPHLFHTWQLFSAALPEGNHAIKKAASWLQNHAMI